jgi:adenylate cyclase
VKIELHSPLDGKSWTVGDTCVIGRHPGADVQLLDPNVSREHAMLRRLGDGFYYFYDLDSANGSRVNGISVTSPVKLRHGDQIVIADNLLVLRLGDSELLETNADTGANVTMMIGVQRVPMIFLVADLKGYTELSAQMNEEELAALIGPWYEECRQLLLPSGATIDKFIGDCVFAYWRTTNNTTRADALVAAKALASHTIVAAGQLAERLVESGITLECGVGLHIGEAAVGAFTRGNFTALGDAVNLTFRIEALTRTLNRPILSSGAFLEGWPEGETMFQSLGACPLKGYPQPVEVFGLLE